MKMTLLQAIHAIALASLNFEHVDSEITIPVQEGDDPKFLIKSKHCIENELHPVDEKLEFEMFECEDGSLGIHCLNTGDVKEDLSLSEAFEIINP